MTTIPYLQELFDSDTTTFTNEIMNADRHALELYLIYIYEQQKEMKNSINDLTLSLEMWIGGYPFDEHHKIKQLRIIDNACKLIGKPRTIEELKEIVLKIKQTSTED